MMMLIIMMMILQADYSDYDDRELFAGVEKVEQCREWMG